MQRTASIRTSGTIRGDIPQVLRYRRQAYSSA
jgi:hypothetical protein